jgi:hypothetical protein
VLLEWHARVVVGLLCFCAWGCDRLPTVVLLAKWVPMIAKRPHRRHDINFRRTAFGRVVRLDTVTGEVSVVAPTSTPARPPVRCE